MMFRIWCPGVCVRFSTWLCKSLLITNSVLECFQDSPSSRVHNSLDTTWQEKSLPCHSVIVVKEWTHLYVTKRKERERNPFHLERTFQIKTKKVLKAMFIVSQCSFITTWASSQKFIYWILNKCVSEKGNYILFQK